MSADKKPFDYANLHKITLLQVNASFVKYNKFKHGILNCKSVLKRHLTKQHFSVIQSRLEKTTRKKLIIS